MSCIAPFQRGQETGSKSISEFPLPTPDGINLILRGFSVKNKILENVGSDLTLQFPRPSLRWQIALALTSVYIIWGSTYLAIRFAIETIPPFLMAATRFIVGGVILYVWARSRGAERPSLRNWKTAGVVGGLLLFGGNGGVVWAEQTVPSGIAAVLVGTVPLWMILIEALRPKGVRPTKGVVLGIGIGFFGVILLIGQGGLSAGSNPVPLVGALIVVGATLSWSIGSLYSRSAPLPKSSQLSTAMEMLMGGAIFFVASVISNEWSGFRPANVSLVSSLSVAYLIFFGSLVAFTAYIWLLRATTAAKVSTYAYVNPIVAVVLGWALAGEVVTFGTIVAAGIIIAAVVVITTHRSRKIALKSPARTVVQEPITTQRG